MDNKNALAVIDAATKSGALVFVGQGINGTVPLYKLEVTEIAVKPDNFHDIEGKLVFRKEVCDRISDASGISFIRAEVYSERAPEEPALDLPARTIFVATAQGKTRLPDGSWRDSTLETYAFDFVAKAKAEAKGDAGKEARLKMAYYKAGPMRAATGARLRVIRQLTGMPTGFEKQDIGTGRTFVFSRIIQNTDYILSTHEGRMMAIAAATGVAAQLYGQRPNVQPAAMSGDPAEGARRVSPETADGRDAFGDSLGAETSGAQAPETEENPRVAEIIKALYEWSTVDGPAATRAKKIIDRGETDLAILEPSLVIIKSVASGFLKEGGIKKSLEALDMLIPDPIVLEEVAKMASSAVDQRKAAGLAPKVGAA